MAMVEKGMDISILPDLILQRVPYKIEIARWKSRITVQSGSQ